MVSQIKMPYSTCVQLTVLDSLGAFVKNSLGSATFVKAKKILRVAFAFHSFKNKQQRSMRSLGSQQYDVYFNKASSNTFFKQLPRAEVQGFKVTFD